MVVALSADYRKVVIGTAQRTQAANSNELVDWYVIDMVLMPSSNTYDGTVIGIPQECWLSCGMIGQVISHE